MQYHNIKKAYFLCRPNRFIAHCLMEGEEVVCHVKNTGRCRELLTDHATVYLEESSNPVRKTKYDLIAVEKGDLLINMDSAAPNAAAGEWLKAGQLLKPPVLVKPEQKHGDSRFDFYMENSREKAWIEVKGVTLERAGIALFPDAPTQRGVKHINGLIRCVEEGYSAYLLLVVQMKGVDCFRPNRETDPVFAQTLLEAARAGVQIHALDCVVTPDSMRLDRQLPVMLT